MRTRTFTLLAVFALVLAACGGSGSEDDTSTSFPAQPDVEAVQLSYALEAGTFYTYEVDLNQTIDMTTSGDTTSMGEGEELPGEMSMVIAGTTSFTHTVADGPEAGTYEVTITGDFSGMEFSGTVDGEPVDSTEIPEMAEMGPVDVTIIVDEQGNLIPDETSGLGEDLLGGFGGMDMLGSLAPAAGTDAGQFVGPPFSEEEVTVGDTWSNTTEIPTLSDEDPVTVQIDSVVTGTDEIDGNEVFVIDTTTSTSAVEFDLAELLIGFMTAFVPEDMSEEEQAELDAMVENLRFAFSVDPSVSEMTTRFDYEAGLARQATVVGDTHLVMDVSIPDETTGDLVEFGVDMSLGQDITYRLIDSGTA